MTISTNAEVTQKIFYRAGTNIETKTMSSKQGYLEHIVSCVTASNGTVLEVAAGTCACERSLAPLVQPALI